MHRLIGLAVLTTAVALLVRFVNLLDCSCGEVVVWDFVLVFNVVVVGFAVMLPDKEE